MVRKQMSFKILFSLIGGVSATAALFTVGASWHIFSIVAVSVPLFLEAVGAIGLLANWFSEAMPPGRIVNILQWIAGILGIAAIFDLTMRFTREAAWMLAVPFPFVMDAILILLFLLWMVVSHYVKVELREGKQCRFC